MAGSKELTFVALKVLTIVGVFLVTWINFSFVLHELLPVFQIFIALVIFEDYLLLSLMCQVMNKLYLQTRLYAAKINATRV